MESGAGSSGSIAVEARWAVAVLMFLKTVQRVLILDGQGRFEMRIFTPDALGSHPEISDARRPSPLAEWWACRLRVVRWWWEGLRWLRLQGCMVSLRPAAV